MHSAKVARTSQAAHTPFINTLMKQLVEGLNNEFCLVFLLHLNLFKFSFVSGVVVQPFYKSPE